ncbi:hypothetical protein RM780_13995 [Streptomyces sp. DSM 44917]|uniref:Uncharacterized protein n=1 Tax=Streptomyces boetiae TaxID=3075541 RepID=A0ABU2L989_9ACTN|nr:hypothetical protein [Streptomyces sp. DSM 44917]MDT0308067.1 hypothetical protein [Streptomyces sp. DSM 44917]
MEGHDAPRRRSFWTDRTGRSGDHLDRQRAAEKAAGNPADYAADRKRILRHLVRLEAAGRLDGVRLAADAGEWMHAVRAEPIGRSDFQSKVEAVALAMASTAHQQATTVRRRHALLAETATAHAGRPVTTRDIGKAVKRLAEHGLLVALVAARAPREGEAHGTVPLYALTVPETVDPVLPDRVPGGRGRRVRQRRARRANTVRRALGLPVDGSANLARPAETYAHDQGRGADRRPGAGHYATTSGTPGDADRRGRAVDRSGNRNRGFSRRGGSSPLPPTGVRPPRARRGEISTTSTERFHARLLAARLRADSATLRKIAPGRLTKIIAPFAAAGWSPSDVMHALDHRPDGTAHIHPHTVRCPPGWAAWRLGHWRTDGAVVTSRSQQSVPGWRWPAYDTGDINPIPARPWEVRFDEPLEPGPRFADPKAEARRIARDGSRLYQAETERQAVEDAARRAAVSARFPQLAAIDAAFAARRIADAEQHDREMQRLEAESPILRARNERLRHDTARLGALARARAEKASRRSSLSTPMQTRRRGATSELRL